MVRKRWTDDDWLKSKAWLKNIRQRTFASFPSYEKKNVRISQSQSGQCWLRLAERGVRPRDECILSGRVAPNVASWPLPCANPKSDVWTYEHSQRRRNRHV